MFAQGTTGPHTVATAKSRRVPDDAANAPSSSKPRVGRPTRAYARSWPNARVC